MKTYNNIIATLPLQSFANMGAYGQTYIDRYKRKYDGRPDSPYCIYALVHACMGILYEYTHMEYPIRIGLNTHMGQNIDIVL